MSNSPSNSELDHRRSSENLSHEMPHPATTPQQSSGSKPAIPAYMYVVGWIMTSGSVIIFNKWVLYSADFKFPIFLTAWHMLFATIVTQIMSRTSHILDDRHKVAMSPAIYIRGIAPIGLFYSLSLALGNTAYLYLSVSFIQMLKATTPVVVLILSYVVGTQRYNPKTLLNVCVIVVGIVIASYGEIAFNLTGFIAQFLAIVFEAGRLALMDQLLNDPKYKMNPLVSLYYFAPVCCFMLSVAFLVLESSQFTLAALARVGYLVLLFNGMVAFTLNVASVLLIGKTSSLVLTLCGVLKDILLVAASMLIWNSQVTLVQAFGYSIALMGLVYYKLGYQQLRDAYYNIKQSDKFSSSSSSNTRKVATILTSLIALIIMLKVIMSPHGGDSSVSTPLDSSSSFKFGKFQIALFVGATESETNVADAADEITNVLGEKNINNVKIYQLQGDAGAQPAIAQAYVNHIVKNFDSLSNQDFVLFAPSRLNNKPIFEDRIRNLLRPETGFLDLSGNYRKCKIGECIDETSTSSPFYELPQLVAMVTHRLITEDDIPMASGNQFIISGRRIHKVGLEGWKTLADFVQRSPADSSIPASSSSAFSQAFKEGLVERSWMGFALCLDSKIADQCPGSITDGYGSSCQCLDN